MFMYFLEVMCGGVIFVLVWEWNMGVCVVVWLGGWCCRLGFGWCWLWFWVFV